METILIIISVISTAAAVAAIVWNVSRSRREKELQSSNSGLQAQVTTLMAEKAALEAKLSAQEETRRLLDEQREESLKAEKEQIGKSLEEMRNAFKALSAENSEHFRKQSAESVEQLLKPIKEKFEKFDKSVQDSELNSAKRGAALEKMVQILSDKAMSVGDQARALADAITGQSKAQGDFGEMLLSDLLRSAGLEEGVNYDVQSVMRDDAGHEIKSEDGRTMLPDVIVHYPDGGEVIVDSKVSLKAYVKWNSSQNAEERKAFAREHVESVRSHVKELRAKDYASYIPEGRKKIDYNIMFIPVEGAFRLMQEESPLLWNEAKEAGVLIVSQMSLSIVLNMVLIAWRHHDQQRNIEEVYDTAAELMSALHNWMDQYVAIGDKLNSARKAYDESMHTLTDSRQSVVKKIAKLEKLRVGPKRSRAAIKAGGRMVGGRESVIPQELSSAITEEDNNTEDQI